MSEQSAESAFSLIPSHITHWFVLAVSTLEFGCSIWDIENSPHGIIGILEPDAFCSSNLHREWSSSLGYKQIRLVRDRKPLE
jgi:hypothetical protein